MQNSYNYTSPPSPSKSSLGKKLLSPKFLVVVAALIIVIGGFLAFQQIKHRREQSEIDKVASSGQKIVYPDAWQEIEISKIDEIEGVVLNLERRNPDADFFVSNYGKSADIQKLLDEAEQSLKDEKSTNVISKETVMIAGKEVVQLRYTSLDKKTSKQYETLKIVIPTNTIAVYTAARTHQGDFAEVEDEVRSINESVVRYVTAHQ